MYSLTRHCGSTQRSAVPGFATPPGSSTRWRWFCPWCEPPPAVGPSAPSSAACPFGTRTAASGSRTWPARNRSVNDQVFVSTLLINPRPKSPLTATGPGSRSARKSPGCGHRWAGSRPGSTGWRLFARGMCTGGRPAWTRARPPADTRPAGVGPSAAPRSRRRPFPGEESDKKLYFNYWVVEECFNFSIQN